MNGIHVLLNRENILYREGQLLKAVRIRNMAMLDDLLNDDLLFIIPGGGVITKSMDR